MARTLKKAKAPARKATARKAPPKKSLKAIAVRKSVKRPVRRSSLTTALKAHKKALETVNSLQKKLDKALEAQKKAYAKIESIKAKAAAKEAKAVAKNAKADLNVDTEDAAL